MTSNHGLVATSYLNLKPSTKIFISWFRVEFCELKSMVQYINLRSSFLKNNALPIEINEHEMSKMKICVKISGIMKFFFCKDKL